MRIEFQVRAIFNLLVSMQKITSPESAQSENHGASHLVLPFGSPEELLHSVHSLLESLPLVDLDHFLLMCMIGLELFHFDPGTGRKHTQSHSLVAFVLGYFIFPEKNSVVSCLYCVTWLETS